MVVVRAPSLFSLPDLTRRGSATLSLQEREKGRGTTPVAREGEGRQPVFGPRVLRALLCRGSSALFSTPYLGLSGILGQRDFVIGDFLAQRVAIEPQHPRGLDLVASRALERELD